jgi:hypothetical protein
MSESENEDNRNSKNLIKTVEPSLNSKQRSIFFVPQVFVGFSPDVLFRTAWTIPNRGVADQAKLLTNIVLMGLKL